MDKKVQKRLGEIALKVKDIESMTVFYRDVIGLSVLRKEPHMVFFEISEGFEGHTAILALFKREGETSASVGTLDHIAFSISLEDFEKEKARLENLGQKVQTNTHNWVQWRSLYVYDPEGNEVEFVCFDPSIPKNMES
jgi:catechol-2,3-dioxygenase